MEQSNCFNKRERLTCIPYGHFQHTSASKFTSKPRNIFTDYKEVSYYYGDRLQESIDDSIRLKSPSDKLAFNSSRSNKRELLGSDLYDGWERFVPLSPKILNSPKGCYLWIDKWEHNNKASYSQRSPFTIVTPRHYLVELTMQLFQKSKYSILCTHLGDGRIVLSKLNNDKQMQQKNQLSSCNITMSKKILHSGYALEDLLTQGPHGKDNPFFAIIEANLDENISLVLRCELDSYNTLRDTFTEIKCFAPLNMQNANHREKLLKTWVQLELSPRCDLVIGVRNTQVGQLQDLQYFTKEKLYRKINDRNLPRSPKRFNFNADLAAQWCQHCIRSICKLVDDNVDCSSPQCFKLTVDESHRIQIEKLKHLPTHVELPAH